MLNTLKRNIRCHIQENQDYFLIFCRSNTVHY